jgi:hypothetical protein
MYVLRNNEARSRNHCCSGKVISIAYSECVLLSLDIQHAMRMRHGVWLGRLYIIFPHFLINGTTLGKSI